MILKNRAEFGVELALAVPHAYWLHKHGLLDAVVTSKGMKPFYYFCNDVREEYTSRTIDNAEAGLNDLPNNWIHHNAPNTIGKAYDKCTEEEQAECNGRLDYSQWELPPYKDMYGELIPISRKTAFISNVYNHPNSGDVRHYHHFTVQGIYDMFCKLTDMGYDIVYKRENNKSKGITIDQNEQDAANIGADIKANVEGIGIMTDYELCEHFDNVYDFNDLAEQSEDDYNTTQLKLMADCDKFISVCGGNSILSSCFGGDVIIYITQGRELRPGYLDENSYFRKLSGANIIPIIDTVPDIKERGHHDYSGIMTAIDEYF